MFNLWNRSYVHTFNQRSIFESKTILADAEYDGVVFLPSEFTNGGQMVYRDTDLNSLLDTYFNGNVGNLFSTLLSDRNSKWSIVLKHRDYYYLLGCYLKELQYSYKLSDDTVKTLAFTYLYDNFYYTNDALFADGFVAGSYSDVLKAAFSEHQATGVLDLITPTELPTEIGYFLMSEGILTESDLHDNFVHAAKMVVARLWDIHRNDFSEWMVLDTKHFLNMMKADDTAEVLSDDFSLSEMLSFVQSDRYLKNMFFQPFDFSTSNATWINSPNFKATASRLVLAWERLADYLVERGLDSEWASLRHADHSETLIRQEYVKKTCAAVKYLLELDGAPEMLEAPVSEMLGYDILSECMDKKYNKTLMLFALRGCSPAFASFIKQAFGEQ
jgi:hypothetical protein